MNGTDLVVDMWYGYVWDHKEYCVGGNETLVVLVMIACLVQ